MLVFATELPARKVPGVNHLDDLMVCREQAPRKVAEPCSIVIFGASGDLTARKLIPALYHLFKDAHLPSACHVIGVARRPKTDSEWRTELRADLEQFSRTRPLDEAVWGGFAANVRYCQGDITDDATYARLRGMIADLPAAPVRQNLLFYLATQPSQFAEIVTRLAAAGLLHKDRSAGWERVVVEKPFGHDLASAQDLNTQLLRHAREGQMYRIDHFLGKETVQNILMFRFGNAIFERLWHRDAVDHVQITVSEKNGVGQRGGYYEEAGALRDMVQNHLLQVLALIGMEPPASLDPEDIRDEKVKLLKSIRPLRPEELSRVAVRGQYFAGLMEGQPQPGYRQETKVRPQSNTETYAAVRLMIDNWRWSGVPFYLRTGKCLPLSASEVRVQFRATPHVLFAATCEETANPNALTLRLQPNEGISLRFNGKIPGSNLGIRPVRMQFRYDTEFGAYTPEAYERLLLDAVAGDATLFIRRDEVETAWALVDPIRRHWDQRGLTNREFYAAGTWGPVAGEELLSRDGYAWRDPQPAQ